MAWALDVGVKQSEFKDLWDVELGATYIPWSKVPDNLEQLADGAFIDDESLPETVRSNYGTHRYTHTHNAVVYKKTWQYICDHNCRETRLIFMVFALHRLISII